MEELSILEKKLEQMKEALKNLFALKTKTEQDRAQIIQDAVTEYKAKKISRLKNKINEL